MRLPPGEFRAVNSRTRRFLQRWVEFPLFRRLGLNQEGLDILEIGCGSGYGAVLMARLRPRSYVGVDLMPEQIALAQQRGLAGAEFLELDATDLGRFPADSKDTVVIFNSLHHIPGWREVIRECYRVLRPGGKLFLEEPSRAGTRCWELVFRRNHAKEALFSMTELQDCLRGAGFTIARRINLGVYGSYCARKPSSPAPPRPTPTAHLG